jgi:hypothetical protein
VPCELAVAVIVSSVVAPFDVIVVTTTDAVEVDADVEGLAANPKQHVSFDEP